MLDVHHCCLPTKDASGLKKLSPNASLGTRIARRFRKMIILDPKNYKCTALFHNKSAILSEQRRHIRSRFSFVVHPCSTLSSVHEVLFFIIWITKMVCDPVIENMKPVNSTLDTLNNYVFLNIQLVLIAASFLMGYVDLETREVVFNPLKVAVRYLKTFFFFDLVAVETLRWGVQGIHVDPSWRLRKIIQYIHVIGLYIRLYTVLRYLNNMGKMMRISREVRRCIGYVVKTYLYLHFFCGLVYFIPRIVYFNKWPNDSWLVIAKIHPESDASLSKIYRECFLMAICYFFGASQGKYIIYQTNEQICFTSVALFGRLYTLFLLADALSLFGIVGVSQSGYERRLSQLKEYMISNNLPHSLKTRMIMYYEYKLDKRYFNEKEILGTLSENLRNELFLFSARTLIQKCHIFKYLPHKDIAALIAMMRQETFAPGNVLFTVDEERQDVYFIASGSVAVLNREGTELCHLEDGDPVGLILKEYGQNDFSAVVLEVTEAFVVNFNELYKFLEPFPLAWEYLHVMIRERLATYKRLEVMASRTKRDTCIVDLRAGRLLERKHKRKSVEV